MWSRDLGNLLLASDGGNGILKNCIRLECCFSVLSTSSVSKGDNSNDFL